MPVMAGGVPAMYSNIDIIEVEESGQRAADAADGEFVRAGGVAGGDAGGLELDEARRGDVVFGADDVAVATEFEVVRSIAGGAGRADPPDIATDAEARRRIVESRRGTYQMFWCGSLSRIVRSKPMAGIPVRPAAVFVLVSSFITSLATWLGPPTLV